MLPFPGKHIYIYITTTIAPRVKYYVYILYSQRDLETPSSRQITLFIGERDIYSYDNKIITRQPLA